MVEWKRKRDKRRNYERWSSVDEDDDHDEQQQTIKGKRKQEHQNRKQCRETLKEKEGKKNKNYLRSWLSCLDLTQPNLECSWRATVDGVETLTYCEIE